MMFLPSWFDKLTMRAQLQCPIMSGKSPTDCETSFKQLQHQRKNFQAAAQNIPLNPFSPPPYLRCSPAYREPRPPDPMLASWREHGHETTGSIHVALRRM
jgi:hypothetical protein